MNKLLSIFLLIKIVAAATEKDQTINAFQSIESYSSSLSKIDEIITTTRLQNAQNIRNYDLEIEILKQQYVAQLHAINASKDFLVDSIVQTQERLELLSILSNSSQTCITNYKYSLPSVSTTQNAIDDCINVANYQLNGILSNPIIYRNDLDDYYKSTFECNIERCKSYSSNEIMCVLSVVTESNTYTANNAQEFNTEMKSSELLAKKNFKKAMNCSFATHNHTISMISETNTLIDICIQNPNVCVPYEQVCYSCPYVDYVQKSKVHEYYIDNPFYQMKDIKPCLMLKVK